MSLKDDLSDKAQGGLRYEAGRDGKVVVLSTWQSNKLGVGVNVLSGQPPKLLAASSLSC